MALRISPRLFPALHFPRRTPRLAQVLVLTLGGLVLAAPLAGPLMASTEIRAVTLSTAGLALIESEGQLGESPIRLTLDRANIDDFLKSLWVLDPSGAVPFVTLTGPGSFEDAFAHLPFGPQDVTDPGRLFGAMIGAPLIVERRGESWEGLNMGVIQRPGEHGMVDVLRLQAEDGVLSSFVMDEALGVRFAEAADQATLTEALRAWRATANPRRVALVLDSEDRTPRSIGLAYLQNAPLWRTAWRAVDTPEGIRLIGWALVENTTGIDWQDVSLTLATGSVRAIEAQLYARRYAAREAAEEPGMPPPVVEPVFRGALGAMAEVARPQAAMADSSASVAVQADDGDSFSRFTLETPVTLAAGQMLSVPFLSELLEDARLTLYRGGQGALHPVIALSLANPLPLRLPAGVLTLYEEGRGHAGDAMIPEMAPGATEVVDFARDTAVEIREEATSTETLRELRLADGVLIVTEDLERRVTYRIEGAPGAARTITIDHPRRSGWSVSSAEGAEERPDAWRWQVPVAAGERAMLVVTERQPRLRRVGLVDMDVETLAFWEGQAVDASVRETLEQIGTLRRQIREAENEQRRQAGTLQALEREQQRLVNLIVQLGDDSQANRERRARVDAIDAEIAQAQVASEAAGERALSLRAEIARLVGQG